MDSNSEICSYVLGVHIMYLTWYAKVVDNVGVADEKFDKTKKETRAREALKANGK